MDTQDINNKIAELTKQNEAYNGIIASYEKEILRVKIL